MKVEEITGPDDKPLYLTYIKPPSWGHLAFVRHGDGGKNSLPHMQAITNGLLANRFLVVLIDDTDPGEPDAPAFETRYPDDPDAADGLGRRVASISAERTETAIAHALEKLDCLSCLVAGFSMGGYAALSQTGPHISDILAVAPARLDDIDVNTITAPVKIIVGSKDALKLPAKAFYERRLPQKVRSNMVIIDGVNHEFSDEGARTTLETMVTTYYQPTNLFAGFMLTKG